MSELFEFLPGEDGIIVVRCYGENDRIVIPDRIGGQPVKEAADHIFAAQRSRKYKKEELHLSQSGNWGYDSGASPGSSLELPEQCTGLLEIRFGRFLRRVGSYAFYGCRKLERIVFPDTLSRLDSGIFTACNHLREIVFYAAQPETPPQQERSQQPETPKCLRNIVNEMDHEITVSVCDSAGKEWVRLLYPGYYEDSIENTPARIIEVKYEGTGYKYRQSFRGNEIDYEMYDSWFYLAKVQEDIRTSMTIALNRLLFPHQLQRQAKESYLDFLRERYEACADHVLHDSQETDLIRMLIKNRYFTETTLAFWIGKSAALRHPQAVGMLMEERNKRFPVKKKTYDF